MAGHILIVEDDRALAKTCARVLESAGYSVEQVHDGAAAEQAVSDSAPAVILLDLLIPKRDGRAVLAGLASSPSTAKLPVVAMSGVFKRRSVLPELQRNAAVKGFLEKPFSAKELLREVSALVGAPERRPVAEDVAPARERLPVAEVPLPAIVWQICQAGASGTLHLEDRTLQKALLFIEGAPAAIRSNAMAETLGRMLVFRKRIDEATFEAATRRAASNDDRIGDALVEMGAIEPKQLEIELRAQAVQKVLEPFTWRTGSAWFEQEKPTLSYASSLAGWTGRLLVLRGAARLPEPRIRSLLAPLADRRVARSPLPLEAREQRERNVASLLSDLRPGITVRALADTHHVALYGLWLIGALDLEGERPAALRGGGLPQARPAPEATDRAAELRAVQEALRGQTYFEALGIPREAAPEVVQRAYMTLAKRYHPDRFAAESDEVKQLAGDVFATLTTARETLTDASRRDEYEAQLSGESAAPERIHRALDAERLFREGEALVRRREYASARRVLGEACKLDPGESEFHALYGWAHFVAANAAGGSEAATAEREAIEALKQSLDLAPESPKGHYYLAQIHKACGRVEQAEKLLKKVLALDPAHTEALQSLRVIQMRKTKEPKTGLFGMGRKKS